jgi:hypothetical protein
MNENSSNGKNIIYISFIKKLVCVNVHVKIYKHMIHEKELKIL